jgi:hypothetical protein
VLQQCPELPPPPAAVMTPPSETDFLKRLENVILGRD